MSQGTHPDPTTPVELPVTRTGRPGGRPLVLLHGYSDARGSFDLLAPHLADAFELVAPDLRGHGTAPRPDAGYTMADMAADVVATLDAAGLDRVALLGHSMGSLVARAVAARHPARVDALVLVGTLPPVADEGMAAMRGEVHALGDELPEEWVREFQTSTSGPTVPAAFLEEAVRTSHRMPARVWRAVVDGLAELDDSADLGAVRAPTLLLWGDRDPISSEADQHAVAAAVPGARLRVLEGIGHAPHWEDPARVAREVLDFLDAR